MEGKKSKPRALLVFGAPCSGKTTFSEKFAEKFDLAYYNLDQITDEYHFKKTELLDVLKLIAKTRHTLVIEGGIGTEAERKKLKKMFMEAGYEVYLIWIQTDVATIRMRMKMRYKSVAKAKDAYDALVGGMEAPTATERPIILSGKHTFETQTKHVLAGLADVNKR